MRNFNELMNYLVKANKEIVEAFELNVAGIIISYENKTKKEQKQLIEALQDFDTTRTIEENIRLVVGKENVTFEYLESKGLTEFDYIQYEKIAEEWFNSNPIAVIEEKLSSTFGQTVNLTQHKNIKSIYLSQKFAVEGTLSKIFAKTWFKVLVCKNRDGISIVVNLISEMHNKAKTTCVLYYASESDDFAGIGA